jgi:phenylacetic acid degradation operon negative regulatory protein
MTRHQAQGFQPDPPFAPQMQQAVNALCQVGDLRVWSVIVTLFGDLAQSRTDQISGTTLSRLCANMGIKPQAMRVALHRLRKDGWIISEKSGRTSLYRLSETGFGESLAARPRIYARKAALPKLWHLAIAQPMSQINRAEAELRLTAKGYVTLTPGTYLGAGSGKDAPLDCLTLKGEIGNIPDWLRTANAPAGLTGQYAKLETTLALVAQTLAQSEPFDAVEAATLRVLIVHNWRRLLLRHADLPAMFYPDDWRGAACRKQVIALLDHLPRPTLADLARACC